MYTLFFYYFIFIGASIITAACNRKIQNIEEKGYVLGKSYKIIILMLVIGLPTLVLCIRSGIGIDYSNYQRYFERYKDVSIDCFINGTGSYEIMNWFIIKLIYRFGGTYKTCFAIYGLLTNVFFGLTLLHNRKLINLSHGICILYLVMFPEMTNTVRQMFAVSIVMFSLKYCEQKKLIKFMICIVAAILVHNSAIICIAFFFVYLLGENRHSIKTKVLMLIVIISPLFTSFLLQSLSSVELLSKYYTAYDMTSSVSSSATLVFRIIAYIPAILLFRKNIYADDKNKYWYYLMLMDMALIIMGSVQKWGFRFAYYTMLVQVVVSAMCIKSQKNNFANRVALKIYYIVYYMLQFYILYYVWGRSGIFPYTTIWN